jgi:hypothetical protein
MHQEQQYLELDRRYKNQRYLITITAIRGRFLWFLWFIFACFGISGNLLFLNYTLNTIWFLNLGPHLRDQMEPRLECQGQE